VATPSILLLEQQKSRTRVASITKAVDDGMRGTRSSLELPQNDRATLAAIHSNAKVLFSLMNFRFSGMGLLKVLAAVVLIWEIVD